MNHEQIRRTIIIALVSDDALMEQLVLKGGNALAIVHEIGARTSLDLDYSLEGDFTDAQAAGRLIEAALTTEFRRHDIVVFDFKCEAKPGKPSSDTPSWWGGYLVSFKLIGREAHEDAKDLSDARRRALMTGAGAGAKGTFKIDISKHEYTSPRVAAEIEDFAVYVYTPEMIAVEKIRAICQQMPEYGFISEKMKRARARDFYDIYAVLTSRTIDLTTAESLFLLREVFSAKGVPVRLLSNIGHETVFNFHETGWASVEASAKPEHGFRFYFDFVSALVATLKPLWEEDSPS